MAFDMIVRGGLVVDGSGGPPLVGDVAVDDGMIVEVARRASGSADQEIDASGLVVAPGFIDVHTHYDAQVLWDPLLGSSTQYGVTTIVMGNCGFGIAPVRSGDEGYLVQLLARVEGMPVAALEAGVPWGWTSYGEYLDNVERRLGPNVVAMVGHSALRYATMGEAAYERTATEAERDAMQDALRGALRAGAWGFSSSTTGTHNDLAGRPAPSRLADAAEYRALADVVGDFPFGLIGMSPGSKLRGLDSGDRGLMTELSLRGDAAVVWNPLAHSPQLPDLWRVNLSASVEASDAGARVFAVFNPGPKGSTRVDLESCFLFEPLPHWKPLVALSHAERVARFADPDVRVGLADDLENDTSMGLLSARLRTMWPILRIAETFSEVTRPFRGRTVGEVAAELSRAPLDVMLDLAVADDLRTVFVQEFAHDDVPKQDDGAEEAFAALSTSPHVLFGGTDAGAHLDMLANESMPVSTLAWRVRQQRSLSLEAAVHGFTGRIADAIGLRGRGRIAPGMHADLVVFDLEEVGAGPAHVVSDLPGNCERMTTTAAGIGHTIVNGTIIYQRGEPTGALPGRLLRGGTGSDPSLVG